MGYYNNCEGTALVCGIGEPAARRKKKQLLVILSKSLQKGAVPALIFRVCEYAFSVCVCFVVQATTAQFPAESVDNIFTSVATSAQTLARKVDNKSGVSTFGLLDFILAIVHVAYHRYAAEHPSQVGMCPHFRITIRHRFSMCACCVLSVCS
jgi:hypothetical protein